MRKIALLTTLLLTVACGSDPVAPTPQPASVAGNWSGTLQGTQPQTGTFLIAAAMVLSQSGSSVSGTWSVQGANGTVTGTTTPSDFTGTFTWNAVTTSGTACTGTWAVSGNAAGATINWTSPLVTGNCTNLPNTLTLAMQRR